MHESSHSQHGESDEKSSTETEEDAVSLADIPDLNNYHDVFQPRDRERQSPLPFRVQPLGFYRFFYRISHEFLPFFFGCGFHQLSPVSFFSSAAIFFGREGGGVLFLTEFRFGFAAFYDFDRLLTGLGFAFLRFQTARRSFPFSRFVTESERESNWAPEKKIIRFKWRDMEKQHLTYLSPVSSFVNPVKPGRNFSEL